MTMDDGRWTIGHRSRLSLTNEWPLLGPLIRTFFIGCALLGCVTACGRKNATNDARRAAVLRYPMIEEPPTLDPARFQDVYVTEMLGNVFEGLVTTDSTNKIAPCLAERWDISPDAMIYTFHLRSNARFHSGRLVTAADFKYSMERALAKKTRSPTAATYLRGIVGVREYISGRSSEIQGIQATDPRTLTIRLDKPMAYFLGMMTYPTAWAVCKEAVEETGGIVTEKSAIGTGPFKLSEYKHGSKVTLTAFPEYYGGKPLIDRIERPIVIDPQTMHVMYENGEIDFFSPALSDYTNDQSNPKLKSDSHLLPQANLFYLVLHQRLQPVFKDKRVRLAFALAIDREELSRIAYLRTSPAAYSFLPPAMPGSNPNIRKLPYDPAAARKLLAEAGYPGGQGFPRLTLVYLEKQPEWNAMAQVIRDSLKKELGITIDLQEHEAGSFWADTSDSEKIPFYISGWVADYLDPQDFLSTLLRSGAPYNHVAYSNPEFDSLCDRADAEPDAQERYDLYRQADQIAMDDVAVIPLVFYNQPVLTKPYLRDYAHNLLYFMLPHRATRIAPH